MVCVDIPSLENGELNGGIFPLLNATSATALTAGNPCCHGLLFTAMATESKGIDTASSALANMIWGATCPCENVRDIVDRSGGVHSVDCSYIRNQNCYGTNSWKLVCKVDWNVSRLRLLKDVVGGGEVVVSTMGVLANRVRVTEGGIGPELAGHRLLS